MRRNRVVSTCVVFFTALFIAGCATAPKSTTTRIYLSDLCDRYGITYRLDRVSNVVTLKKDDMKAKALIGSDSVIMGTKEILLSGPLTKKRKNIIVPFDFKRKIIDKLRQIGPSFFKEFYKIVVDPGHGGKDPGALGRTGTKEKNIVLDISRRLKKKLDKKNIHIVMTRDRDEFISLEKRTEIAVNEKADLFISIHANSSPSRRPRGIEVWSTRILEEEDMEHPQRIRNQSIMFNELSIAKDNPGAKGIVSDLLYRYQQVESQRLASYVAEGLSSSMKVRNRGSKKSGFFVLRNALMPAILVEVGFLSNPHEEKLLKKSSYKQKIADELAESILEYVGFN